jgi:hypothetical protein
MLQRDEFHVLTSRELALGRSVHTSPPTRIFLQFYDAAKEVKVAHQNLVTE